MYVSQCENLSSLPMATSMNDFCSVFVMLPILPSDIVTLSTWETDLTSAAVPVMKISSAAYKSSRSSSRSVI